MHNQKNLPLFRVSVCPVIGKNDDGSNKLGTPEKIGAVWRRNEPGKGAILRRDGDDRVLLLQPVKPVAGKPAGAQ